MHVQRKNTGGGAGAPPYRRVAESRRRGLMSATPRRSMRAQVVAVVGQTELVWGTEAAAQAAATLETLDHRTRYGA